MDDNNRLPVEQILNARAANWPAAATPAARLMIRVLRLADLAMTNAAGCAASQGVSLTEFDVLSTLRGAPPPHELTPTDLCAAVLVSSGGLTKILHGLEAKGLVLRFESCGDGRSKPVRLSEAGREAAQRTMDDVLRADAGFIEPELSAAELETLTGMIGRLLARLESGGHDTENRQ
jgi:DNA-binding MarR family transcriptional regulator